MHVVIGGNGDDVDPGGDLSAVLETIIGASEGDVGRATDESEAFEWLVGTAGYGGCSRTGATVTIPIRSSRNWRRDSWNSQVIDGDEPL